jgi:hypothetical protein
VTFHRSGGCPFRVDTVEKVFLRPEQIFPEALARPSKKLFRGTHDQSDFQPAVFVSSPEGAGLWNAGFDRRARTNFGQFVFGFFDSIGQQETSGSLARRTQLELRMPSHPHNFGLLSSP